MAKYLVDIDALLSCCDFLTLGNLNGKEYTYTDNVRALIQRFPKDKVEETITVEVKNKATSEADGEILAACKEYLNEK
jgi:hypothetical protein